MKFELEKFLTSMGLQSYQNVIIHSSFKKIKSALPAVKIEDVIEVLKKIITENGSIIFPTFTYCYKKSSGKYRKFDRINSPSEVGAMSEAFRLSKDVIRTSSPTHSFAIWGKIKLFIDSNNSPASPLGEGSVLDWLAKINNSFVLMLGTDFSSLSFCHYLEIVYKVPWYDYSPWDYLNILNVGVSIDSEQELKEIPGCSRSFTSFEKNLIQKGKLKPFIYKSLSSYLIPIELLINEGKYFFENKYLNLLCSEGSCYSCDSRWKFLKSHLQKPLILS